MTDKRFTMKGSTILENGEEITAWDCYDLLNELSSQNKRLEEKIQRERISFMKTQERWRKEAENKIKELSEENEQLQARNNRQAKQLDRLYRLVEEKNWRTLSDILDDFKRCEEQLQRESGTYW